MRKPAVTAVFSTALCAAAACAPALADDAALFAGRTITVVIGYPPGGGFDLAARMMVQYMPKFIPGEPTMVAQNMPGASSFKASNYIYNAAPKDGTYIGGVVNSIPTHQVIDGRGVRFDAGKFIWLGSTGFANLMTMAWHTAGVRNIKDVFERELLTGVTGVGSGTYIYTNAMNVILGTKFKMVMGYKGVTDIDLAMERGEVMGRGGMSYSAAIYEHSDWLKDGKLVILAQVGLARDKTLPKVPLLSELGDNADDNRILRIVSSPVSVGL